MDELAGHTLGPYRVLDRIGAGGMATVYRAYHAAMDRYVAIKVLPRHLARDPNFHARFLREARTIARLEHRHILTVHDVAEEDGVPFLVMRYTNSGDLSGLIAGQSLTIARAVQLTSEVAEALAYAHRQGVIHRDVKPANVLIGSDGHALLTDFGIAKLYAETLQFTGEGQLVGTPAYMAPEQLQGQPVDARTDVYALGVVLYQALMHLHSTLRPPRQINPSIPEALERVVLRAMAKNPNDRFQTADELAEALTSLNYAGETRAVPSAHNATPAPLDSPAATVPPQDVRITPPSLDIRPPAEPTRVQTPWLALLAGAGITLAAVAVALLLRPGAPTAVAPAAAAPTIVAASSVRSGDLRSPAATAKVNDLAVTADAIWAATDGGLVRWNADGTGQAFTQDDGLPLDEPGAIVSAADGTLWVGGGGVAHLRPTSDGVDVLAYYTKDDGLGAGVIRALLVDPDGSIWAGGPQGSSRFALSHYTGGSWHTNELPTDDPALQGVDLQIQSLLRSRDGSLWLGLRQGELLRWDGQRWARFGAAAGVGPGPSGGDVRIRRLHQSSDGTIWAAGSALGLLRFDAAQARWQPVSVVRDNVPIRAVAQVADGSLWAAGDSLIARSTDNGQTWTEVLTAGSRVGNDIGSLVHDAAGHIWAGAYDGGISVFDGVQWRQLQR